MSFLDRIAECNNADMTRYYPLYGCGARIGWVRNDRTAPLAAYPDVFSVSGRRVDLRLTLVDYESATPAVDTVMRALAADELIDGWRDERYAVAAKFSAPALLSLERAACPVLGVRSWGFHLTGYVRKPDGLYLWIAERAHDKPTYPGKLDNTVAGGHPEGLTLQQNVIKECAEEASIPADLAIQAVPTGMLSYCHETQAGLKPDEMFCFDLEMPEEFTPTPADGEVEAFYLMPVQEVLEIVRDTDRFKYNCALVLISFFVRHGLIHPDNEPDYAAICAGFNLGNRPGI